MAHSSSPHFQTFHALRIKGFANADTLVEMTALEVNVVEQELASLSDAGHVQFRENRGLWQLTPDGRADHEERLAADIEGIDVAAALGAHYEPFIACNTEFKDLCGAWQLRGDAPNDHTDAAYDAEVVGRLADLHARAHPIVAAMGGEMARMAPYADRLVTVLAKVQAGETKMFTGVMCGSYHDVWMELHEDLILTQGIDRAAEGSF